VSAVGRVRHLMNEVLGPTARPGPPAPRPVIGSDHRPQVGDGERGGLAAGG